MINSPLVLHLDAKHDCGNNSSPKLMLSDHDLDHPRFIVIENIKDYTPTILRQEPKTINKVLLC